MDLILYWLQELQYQVNSLGIRIKECKEDQVLKRIQEESFFLSPGTGDHEALQDAEAAGLMQVSCMGNEGMEMERTLVPFGSLHKAMEIYTFIHIYISWQRRVAGCMPAAPQLYKVSTRKPRPYGRETAHGSC